MMIFKKWIFPCCFLAMGMVACKNTSVEEQVKTAPIDMEGYWGADMYIKGLMEEKKLTVQLVCPLAWNNLVFQVKGRQLIRMGLMQEPDTITLSNNPDSLAQLDGFGSFVLRYNRNAARLEATSVDKNTGSCSPENTFRRITPQQGKDVFELLKTYSIRETGPLGI